jgi:O-antigen/teichoic acid export membrane protein
MLLIWLLQAGFHAVTGKYFVLKIGFYLQLLFIASFPYTISLWLGQMEEYFNRILYLRLLLSVPSLVFILSGFFFPFQVETLIQVHLSSYLFASAVAISLGWSHMGTMLQANKVTIKKMLSFGRYTLGTLISTNLLKSTDTFMISWYMGPGALAAYNLPYKLIELIEIPLRSLAATFLPKAVKHSHDNHPSEIKSLFYLYTGLLTLFLMPVATLLILFAEEMVTLLGGETYASSANIFRCFVIYSLFLPLDRFLGITLDILNKPHLNLLKVGLMVITNITGNLLAIYFTDSPLFIAIATIITVSSGVVAGWFILKSTLFIQFNELVYEGYFILKQVIHKQFKSSMA